MRLYLSTTLLILSLGLAACGDDDPDKLDDTQAESIDADGDGYDDEMDCDDGDANVYPGANELCDGLDNDCDGETDEQVGTTFFVDADGDGWGDEASPFEACEIPQGHADRAGDCDDSDASINPTGSEVCNGVDDDCDELVDDDDDSLDLDSTETWYGDHDGDGYGTADDPLVACEQPAGASTTGDDCDDSSVGAHPDADEYCNGQDDDCDGTVDEDTVDAEVGWYADADGDGYGDPGDVVIQCTQPSGYVLDANDCDDSDASTHPDAVEYCDGADNDCDAAIDDDSALDAADWYGDSDGDGYGDAADVTTACYQPSGSVADVGDCDDDDADQYPGADEHCNGEDDDCDGDTDEDDALDVTTWYADTDGDDYGDAAETTVSCDEPSGHSLDASDCDDDDASVNPGAGEWCNGVDDDCDGDTDENDALDVATWYADADADGYGYVTTAQTACDQPSRYVADASDCDDTDNARYPGADETCNGEDDDCDGSIDEDDALDVTAWFEDSDGDGWGNDAVLSYACDAPSGTSAYGGDCDDTDTTYNPGASETDCGDPNDYNCDGSVAYADTDGDGFAACDECDDSDPAQYPGADEHCNGEDDDCDGDIDEIGAVDATVWYADTDDDGFGAQLASVLACDQPSGFVGDNTDCDDTDTDTHPGAAEHCDGEDNDCDGTTDEDDAFDALTWYADTDGDGHGDVANSTLACAQPSAFVAGGDDCNDVDSAQFPGADEHCNGEDDDCDGSIDEDDAVDAVPWHADSDADGFGDASTTTIACTQPSDTVADDMDCDDSDAGVNPAASEACDGVDNDCDGDTDEDDAADAPTWYADTDSDGYGGAGTTRRACTAPSGFIADSSDCDDSSASVNPAASELCDGIDNDCDGDTDEDDAIDAATFYADDDGDAFGDPSTSTQACTAPSGHVADSSDCDDSDDSVSPSASELCDGVDNDCDGDTDEDDATDATTYYMDGDSDGFGDPSSRTDACSAPSGHVTDGSDCDDSDASTNPSASEACDGMDNDCDGDTDEGVQSTYYADGDGDGFGSPDSSTDACSAPSGHVTDGSDCDDSDASTNPSASEACDGMDNDCDGDVDEGVQSTFYADVDDDGYGDPSSSTDSCSAPSGYVSDNSDCDDSDGIVRPGAVEVCDLIDDDCDGIVDDSCISEGDVIITELMNNPAATSDSVGEWFELYNITGDDIELQGLVLRDDDSDLHLIETSLVIPASDYLVLALSSSATTAYDYVYGSDLTLANGSDELALATYGTDGSDGVFIDHIAWDDGATFPDPSGASMNLDPNAFESADNDDGANWCEAISTFDTGDDGTPGADNDPCWLTLLNISPERGPVAGGDTVTLTGVYMDEVTDVAFDGSNIAFTLVSPTEITTTAPAHATGAVDVLITDGVIDSTLTGAYTYFEPVTIGWCWQNYPSSTTTEPGVATELLYGQVWSDSVTAGPSQGAGIDAELGWGTSGSDPETDSSWLWSSADYNPYHTTDDNDEYMGDLTISTEGTYSFVYRFSGDGGTTWSYCDTTGDPFSTSDMGVLVVALPS